MSDEKTILIVDDEENVVKSITRTLRSVGRILTTTSPLDALKILERETVHVIIVDQRMPQMSGIELLTTVYEKYPDVVRIILTGYTDIADLIDAINSAKIYRYLTKPWENKELQLIVSQALERFDLQSQNKLLIGRLKKQNKKLADKEKELLSINKDLEKKISERTKEIRKVNSKLHREATTDPLTTIFNRRYFLRRLEEEFSRTRRFKHKLSILMIDVDYFKEYNDISGHIAGDRALKRIAKILTESSRRIDTVARYGGEEFVILLPETSKNGASQFAERIKLAIEKASFEFERKLPNKRITISIGVAANQDDFTTPDKLLKVADRALYDAKKKGRNCVVVAK
jgi:diguanylate cyclase (GGDEF)-like protein